MKKLLLFLMLAAACAAEQPAAWYQLDYYKTLPPSAGKNAWIYRVRFGGTNSEYNYVAVTRFGSYTEIAGQPRRRAEAVKTDVLGELALVGTIDEPWLSVNFIKSARGMEQDRQDDETRFWKPIHETQLKTGRKGYRGWFATFVRWPSGAGVEYDILSADASDAFELPEGGGLEAEVAEANRNTALHGVTVRRELWERIGRN